MDKYYQKAGYNPAQIKALRTKLQESRSLKKEEEKKRQERLDSLVAQKVKFQKEQQQKILEAAKVKSMEDQGCFREFQSTILISKVHQENKGLLQARKEKKRQESAERASVCEYTGGMLPQPEAVQKYKHEKELQKQRYLQSATEFNKSKANELALEKQRKLKVPPSPDIDDAHLVKQRAKAGVLNSYTENVALKNKRIQAEQKKVAQLEEDRRRAQSDLEAKYEQRRQQKEETFKRQQLRTEAAATKLAELKKEQAIRARNEEQNREKRLQAEKSLKLQQEKDKKANKEAVMKNTARYWQIQRQQREEQKKAEQRSKLEVFKEQCEKEKLLQKKDQERAEKQRQSQSQRDEINARMITDKSVLAKRWNKKEQEDKEKEAQRISEKHSRYKKYVEQEIQKAAADKRIVAPLQDKIQEQESRDDRLYCYRGQKLEVVKRMSSLESRKLKDLELQHADVSEDASNEHLYIRCGSRCDLIQKFGSTPESQLVKEKVERQHISFSKADRDQCTKIQPIGCCPHFGAESCGIVVEERIDYSTNVSTLKGTVKCVKKQAPKSASAVKKDSKGVKKQPSVLNEPSSVSAKPNCAPPKQLPQCAPKTQALPQKPTVPANRVVLKNAPQKDRKLPPIAPKKIPTGNIIILNDNCSRTPGAKGKACEALKVPPILPSPTPVTQNPNVCQVRARRPSPLPKISKNLPAPSPSVRQQLQTPNMMNLANRRPSLPPIAPKTNRFSGSVSSLNRAVQVVPLTPSVRKS